MSVRNTKHWAVESERGSVLVEFSLIAVSLSLLIALLVDVARMVFVSQLLQETARVAARELALLPLSPRMTFEQALQQPLVKKQIYDPAALVIEVDHFRDSHQLKRLLDGLPLVNRMLRPLMINDHITLDGHRRKVLRFPGVVLKDRRRQTNLNSWFVGVPSTDVSGIPNRERIGWKPILEEVRANPDDPHSGSFSLLPSEQGALAGLVAVRINYPFQPIFMNWLPQTVLPDSAAISSEGNADEETALSEHREPQLADTSSTPLSIHASSKTSVTETLENYQQVLSAQAVFRREVFQ